LAILWAERKAGVFNVGHNHLNLPKRQSWSCTRKVTYSNGKWIEWTYDANGTKLKKTTSAGATKHYINGIEYDGTVIEAIYHAEGRASLQGSTYRYEYTLRDHLGNSRVMFADLNSDNEVDETEILQQNHYYPFGMNMEGSWSGGTNRYQYNGKELNEDFGLDWLDYGARLYDAAIARFTAVDPLAEITPSWNPYNYVQNTPINAIDPDGMACVGCGDGNGKPGHLDFISDHQWEMDRMGTITQGGPAQVDPPYTGRTLPTVTVTASRVNRDQSVNRYGYSGSYGQWQKDYGFEDVAKDDASNFHEFVWGDANKALIQRLDKEERDRVVLGKLWLFTGGYAALGSVTTFGFSGSGVVPRGFRFSSPASSNLGLPQVQINRINGNSFRDRIAEALRSQGRDVSTEVYKRTPFGRRYIDIEVGYNGKNLGGVETKFGNARYGVEQRAKDYYLWKVKGYRVNVIRAK
jgi:RHS repeat-associated protein